MPGDSKQIDRRNALKIIGSAAVAGVGLGTASGSVGAFESGDRLERAYSSERRLRVAFQQHGDGLRARLVKEGIVSEDFDFDALEFDIDENVNGLEATTGDRRAAVTARTVKGTPTAIGFVSTSSDTHDIALYVQPERDDAYALVEPKDSDQRFIVTESDVSTAGCLYSECTNDCCADGESYEETWDCCNDTCYLVDTSCSCANCDCASPSCE